MSRRWTRWAGGLTTNWDRKPGDLVQAVGALTRLGKRREMKPERQTDRQLLRSAKASASRWQNTLKRKGA